MSRQLSSHIVIQDPGTPVAGPGASVGQTFAVKALSGNGGNIYIGGTDVSPESGYPLAPGEHVVIEAVTVRRPGAGEPAFCVDADEAGDRAAWLRLN